MKSGFISVIGRPNVGKSTLINTLVGKKVAITSSKPQTTRNIIHGIYNDDDSQIVFVDTPGIHKPNHKLGKVLNESAYYSLKDTDATMWIVDINEEFGAGDLFVLEKIKEQHKPVILVLNKIDKINNDKILEKINYYSELYSFNEIVPVSALKKKNTNELIKTLKNYLPDNVMFYEKDQITNRPLKFLTSEIVREKAFNLTGEEVPHAIACYVESIKKEKKNYIINVAIVVDRDSLKKIVVGANGKKIKQIGIDARCELEQMLNAKVYLELFVKVIKKWRDKEKYLSELGFNDFKDE